MVSRFSRFLAIAISLLAGAATPVFAAKQQAQRPAPSYDTCESLAVRRGSPPGQGGSTYTETQFNAFMNQCLSGKIPLSTRGE